MTAPRARALLVVICGVLASCSGNAPSHTALPPAVERLGSPASGTLTIVVPRATANGARRPQYISSATTQAALFIDSTIAAAGSSTSCSSGCTIAYKTYAGLHTFRAEIADSSNVVLAAGSTSATIAPGTAAGNDITITLNGAAAVVPWISTTSSTATSISGDFAIEDYSSIPITSAPSGASTAFDNAPVAFTATEDQGFSGGAPSFAPASQTAPSTSGNNYAFTAACGTSANGPFYITATTASSAAGISSGQLGGLPTALVYPTSPPNTSAMKRYSCASGDIAVSTLYSSNFTTGNVGAYAVNASTGVPSAVTGQPFAASTDPLGIVIAHNGSFLYVANSGTDTISGYSITASTGALTAITGSPFALSHSTSRPFALAVTPNGSYLYASDTSTLNTLNAYSINASTGALTQLSPATYTVGTTPHGIAVTPSGSFLYVANFGTTTISGYSINASTGALTAIAGSPFSTGSGSTPDFLATNGTYLYASDKALNHLSGFSINSSTGALTALASSPYATGTGPEAVTYDATGSYLYVANNTSGTVSAYSINSSTGALTQLSGSPYTVGTSPVGASVSGSFLYVANSGSSSVSGFKITAGTGTLTVLTGSPFSISGSGVENAIVR